jgi:hypothetical protein
MNPHADSVQQPSETLAREILEICRGWSQATFGWQGDDPDGFSKASRAHDEECICRIVAALSRQAPAAPAAVDFEQWWLAEVAANGGVPVGADYKHWAKKGFELRGEAEAMALLGWTRYEKARKLNPAQWAELHQRNLRGENFDDMIDALPATTQPVQQDTKATKHFRTYQPGIDDVGDDAS